MIDVNIFVSVTKSARQAPDAPKFFTRNGKSTVTRFVRSPLAMGF